VDSGQLRVAIDSIFALAEAAAAFERRLASGKHGKVVIGRVGTLLHRRLEAGSACDHY
jgi:hypothetical protein